MALAALIILPRQGLKLANGKAATVFVELTESAAVAVAKTGVASACLQNAQLLLLGGFFRGLLLRSGGLRHSGSSALFFTALGMGHWGDEQANRTDQQHDRKQVFHAKKEEVK
ncbi:MAG: hypothetical protein EOO58_01700 [Hymenobacter sp.]|nr:MAG: hypothetical protein EOO58_01700 [Hymenobacter sp.]